MVGPCPGVRQPAPGQLGPAGRVLSVARCPWGSAEGARKALHPIKSSAPHKKSPVPHVWPRHSARAQPAQRAAGQELEAHLSPRGRPRCFPLSAQQAANGTSGFNSLPNLRGSNLYFPWERCSTMLNSSLVRGKNKVFFILAFQAELLYKQEHECPEAKKQTRSA